MAFTSADVLPIATTQQATDYLAAMYLAQIPSANAGLAAAQQFVTQIQALFLGNTASRPATVGAGAAYGQALRDLTPSLVPAANIGIKQPMLSLPDAVQTNTVLAAQVRSFLLGLDASFRRIGPTALGSSVTGLDGYCGWYNNPANAGGAAYSMRLAPEVAILWNAVLNGQIPFSGANIFPAYTEIARWQRYNGITIPLTNVPYYRPNDTNGGAVQNGNAVNGSVPQIGTTPAKQGYGAGVLLCRVDQAAAAGNSVTLQVTGQGQDTNGADHTGNRTWTVTISDANGVGTVLTPAPTNGGDRIRAISLITLTGSTGSNTTAGLYTFYVGRDRAVPVLPTAANLLMLINAMRMCCDC